MIFKMNNFWWGIFVATLSPLFILTTYYYAKFAPIDFFGLYFELLLTDHQYIKEIAAGFLLINCFVFYLYVNTDRFKTAYGVFMATLIFGLIVFVINVGFAG